ncbi:MAG: hypothetical protein AAF586_10175 [Planctomycetota bacterium]
MAPARTPDVSAQAAKLAIAMVAWLAIMHTPGAGAAMVVTAAATAHSQSIAWAQSVRRATPHRAGMVTRRPILAIHAPGQATPGPAPLTRPATVAAAMAHRLNLPPPSA